MSGTIDLHPQTYDDVFRVKVAVGKPMPRAAKRNDVQLGPQVLAMLRRAVQFFLDGIKNDARARLLSEVTFVLDRKRLPDAEQIAAVQNVVQLLGNRYLAGQEQHADLMTFPNSRATVPPLNRFGRGWVDPEQAKHINKALADANLVDVEFGVTPAPSDPEWLVEQLCFDLEKERQAIAERVQSRIRALGVVKCRDKEAGRRLAKNLNEALSVFGLGIVIRTDLVGTIIFHPRPKADSAGYFDAQSRRQETGQRPSKSIGNDFSQVEVQPVPRHGKRK